MPLTGRATRSLPDAPGASVCRYCDTPLESTTTNETCHDCRTEQIRTAQQTYRDRCRNDGRCETCGKKTECHLCNKTSECAHGNRHRFRLCREHRRKRSEARKAKRLKIKKPLKMMLSPPPPQATSTTPPWPVQIGVWYRGDQPIRPSMYRGGRPHTIRGRKPDVVWFGGKPRP